MAVLISNHGGRVRAKGLLLLLFFLWAASGCQRSQREDALVLGWGEKLVFRQVFNARLPQHAPDCVDNVDPGCLEVKRQLLVRMIEEAFLLRRAKERGITISKSALKEAERGYLRDYEGAEEVLRQLGHDPPRWRVSLRDRLMIQAAMEEILQGVRVDREEAVAYFHDHRELFVRQREVRVRQIVVARGSEATEILGRLRKGEDFSRLARERSLSPEAAEGGEMGFLRPGLMPPELEDVVFSLEVGKLSDVIPSAYGFHIVQVLEQVPPRELGYSDVEGDIRRRLLGEKTQRSYEAWVQGQWKQAQIQILDPKLKQDVEEGERAS